MSPRFRPANLSTSTGLRTASSLTWSAGRPGEAIAAATAARAPAAACRAGFAAAAAGNARARARAVRPIVRICPPKFVPAAINPPVVARELFCGLAPVDRTRFRCDKATPHPPPLHPAMATARPGDHVLAEPFAPDEEQGRHD